ncbi:hypothetical protein BFP76_08025 [Amylibacter kogurei]|uniref:Glutathione S-transferase n=1 Tax=Paramylibacter kogurei TaxID=1889778 RepID=A0A2G5K3A1_9RHOB|nr:MAPEG family protein [Amylibacter kogurei]PIB23483.1 hypothetical protein BFP76_08025 [Amylibacter kogurei]
MTTLIVTSATAVIMAIWMLAQTISVIKMRRSERIVHGDANNKTVMKRIRGHANNVEQAPLFLILLGLVEYQQMASCTVLAIIAALFVIGRLAHGYYFLDIGAKHTFRQYGMLATMIAQIAIILCLIIGLLF